jgi:hypothetical protein
MTESKEDLAVKIIDLQRRVKELERLVKLLNARVAGKAQFRL